MTEAEYLATQQQLMLLASVVTTMDLDGFIAQADRAESLGPIIDLAVYLRRGRMLGKIKRLAEAARDFQEVAREVVEVAKQ